MNNLVERRKAAASLATDLAAYERLEVDIQRHKRDLNGRHDAMKRYLPLIFPVSFEKIVICSSLSTRARLSAVFPIAALYHIGVTHLILVLDSAGTGSPLSSWTPSMKTHEYAPSMSSKPLPVRVNTSPPSAKPSLGLRDPHEAK